MRVKFIGDEEPIKKAQSRISVFFCRRRYMEDVTVGTNKIYKRAEESSGIDRVGIVKDIEYIFETTIQCFF